MSFDPTQLTDDQIFEVLNEMLQRMGWNVVAISKDEDGMIMGTKEYVDKTLAGVEGVVEDDTSSTKLN